MTTPSDLTTNSPGWLGRRGAVVGVLAALVAATLGALAPSASATEPATFLVQGTGGDAAGAAVLEAGGELTDSLHGLGSAVAELTPEQAAALAADSRVLFVTPDSEVTLAPTTTQSSGRDKEGWNADGTQHTSMDLVNRAIGADLLHRMGIDGTGVDVALIDSGLVPVPGMDDPAKVVNGPDLSFESIVKEIRYLDTFGHGTHLGGIIAGEGESFTGVAPDSRLVSLKVAAHNGATDVSQVLAAINWVIEHRNDADLNIRVLNLAFGTDGTQDYLLDPLTYAVEVAWHRGIVAVVSAGNEGPGSPLRNPAYDPYVLAVGAANISGTAHPADDTIADFSSWGTTARSVDLLAPGVSVASLRNPGSYADELFPGARVGETLFKGSGTSQATAVVAGAAALMLEADPALTPDDVKARLIETARPLRGQSQLGQGGGVIDVLRAAVRPVRDTAQTYEVAAGTGSLELARGSAHVVDGDVELTGEQDIFGDAWDGRTWAGRTWAGRTWAGGEWMGRTWAGDDWSGRSWAGRTWAGRSWTGRSWAGRSWTGRTWAGRTWTGRTWTGRTWTGRTWADADWSGTTWSGRGWAGRTWTAAWE